MTLDNLLYIVVPFVLSTLLTPVVGFIGKKLGIIAEMNERTVHTKKVARIGGVAIYVAFIISMALFTKIDTSMNGVVLGATIMFFGGLLDDMVNLKPKIKLAFQILAAIVLIFVGGVSLDVIHLPLGITINLGIVSFVVTFFWVLGITNAVNLIDGLDGLAGGIVMIILIVIVPISLIETRPDVFQLCLILIGSIAGFLLFNKYPASIFMGDSGSLFLGFMIAAISLLGFKSSTFITLGFPLLLLAVPILDTMAAIVRRLWAGQSLTSADKNHLHHVLMRRFGHRKSVYILYLVTAAFGGIAYVYIINKALGLTLLFLAALAVELFIETTSMLSPKYRPLLSLVDHITGKFKDESK
ncbi:MAG: MraY family glycosyltransferase [Erysipelotrichaceae bacterium]